MISEAIQEALQVIVPNTFQTIGDENITVPFCIHEETDTPEYLKEGLSGYSWQVEIGIVHNSPDAAEALAVQIIAAIELLARTVSHNTIIEEVEFTGTAPGYDEQTREYLKMVRFTISTKNR